MSPVRATFTILTLSLGPVDGGFSASMLNRDSVSCSNTEFSLIKKSRLHFIIINDNIITPSITVFVYGTDNQRMVDHRSTQKPSRTKLTKFRHLITRYTIILTFVGLYTATPSFSLDVQPLLPMWKNSWLWLNGKIVGRRRTLRRPRLSNSYPQTWSGNGTTIETVTSIQWTRVVNILHPS